MFLSPTRSGDRTRSAERDTPLRRGARVALGVALTCGVIGPAGADAAPQEASRPLEIRGAVSARAFLEAVAEGWEGEGRGRVRIGVDATSRVVTRLEAGAPADLLVTADEAWMRHAITVGLVNAHESRPLARNRLVLFEGSADAADAGRIPATPLDGADRIASDLPELTAEAIEARLASVPEGILLALAGPAVPVGRYAREALTSLGLDASIPGDRIVAAGNARSVVHLVGLGEIPFGIGYATDLIADPSVVPIGWIPEDAHSPAELWIAPLRGSTHPDTDAFMTRLSGASSRALLVAYGFEPVVGGEGSGRRADGGGLKGEARLVAVGNGPRDGPLLGPVLWRSVVVGFLAVLLATLPALALGRWLAAARRGAHVGIRSAIGTFLLLPLVLPPVVTGFLLLALTGTSGPLAPLLEPLGIRISFTFWAAVLAAAVVGFPLYAVVVRNAFEGVDPRFEELAWTLGAPPRSAFRRVALPLALPGVVAGAVLAFARGLGEFGATIVVAGSVAGETQTIPLAVYELLEAPGGWARVWVFVAASVAVAAVALAVWEWLSSRQRARLLDFRR
ncbi:MAG: molybdate ABC transporter substrate-binding protein [Longimicrobiales bacterium]|nr:molybdate ABC transporter substrate-binding protein [Longimicrobiales bacterium]